MARPNVNGRRLPATARCRGFGMLELLTAVAFLVILLGLAVSLARYVRATGAEQVTRQVMRQLNEALAARPADAEPLSQVEPPSEHATEAAWADYALRSNAAVRKLAGEDDLICDAWGNPIGFLASQRPQIGMAPHDQPFCFSAGPDGRYLTRDDNQYSYEQLLPTTRLSTPTAGGHSEQ